MHSIQNNGIEYIEYKIHDFISHIGKESSTKYSQKRRFGNWGEGIVCDILQKRGMKIIFRNFLRKCGEIDIVAEKDGVIHFVEVKTVSRQSSVGVSLYNPIESVSHHKMLRMKRTIAVYLMNHKMDSNAEFQIDVVSVVFFIPDMLVRVVFLENIIE